MIDTESTSGNPGKGVPYLEQYWTVEQVAKRLHASESTIKRWCGQQKLKRLKAGGKTLISESALKEFLRLSTEEAAA